MPENTFARATFNVKVPPKLEPLLGKRVLSPAFATRAMDGRLTPFLIVSVQTDARNPVPGAFVEAVNRNGDVVASAKTSTRGLAFLQLPRRPQPARRARDEKKRITDIAGGGDVSGKVLLKKGAETLHEKEFAILQSDQVARVAFYIAQPDGIDPALPPGDNPLANLPADFSEQACEELLGVRDGGFLDPNNLPTVPDPLLPAPAAGTPSLAGGRVPLIRRFNVVRYADDGIRYFIKLRQEWVLLSYSLGELEQVKALDPGSVVQSAKQLVTEAISSTTATSQRAVSSLTQQLQDITESVGVIDAVVTTTAEATTDTDVSGWAIGGFIGGIVGTFGGLFGGGGGKTSTNVNVNLDSRVDTDINTSLLTNRSVQQAASLVNEAVAQIQSARQAVQRTTSDLVNNLAPMVNRVANALHWRVYENYAVCTNVDAVHEIVELDLAPSGVDDFTLDELLAYRAFFEPRLLDATLASGFDAIARLADKPSLDEAVIDIVYDANFRLRRSFGFTSSSRPIDGEISVTLGGGSSTMLAARGNNQTTRTRITLPAAAVPGTSLSGSVTIGPDSSVSPGFLESFSGTGNIRRIEIWLGRSVSEPGDIINNPSTFSYSVPAAGFTNALLEHVNAHKRYYLGVLAQAAINLPSLRTDSPRLAGIPVQFWRLPLIAIEGTVALMLSNETDTIAHAELLDDPGAGTLVQILAPGAYGEILNGILDLPLADLHPLLTEVGAFPFGEIPNLSTSFGGSDGPVNIGNITQNPGNDIPEAPDGGGVIGDTLGDVDDTLGGLGGG